MLTKKEREEIAERFRNYDKAEYVTLYSGMLIKSIQMVLKIGLMKTLRLIRLTR